MPTEVVDIWNAAADRLGVSRVETESEDSDTANLMRGAWDLFRQKFTEDHFWNGARRTVALMGANDEFSPYALSGITILTPKFFQFVWILPEDYVRAVSVNKYLNQRSSGRWMVEIAPPVNAKFLFTEESTAELEYVFDVGGQVHLLSPQMIYSLGLGLAAHVGRKAGKSAIDIQQILSEATLEGEDAKGSDSQEGFPDEFSLTRLPLSRFRRGRGR